MNPELATAEQPDPAGWEGEPVRVLHVGPHATDVERMRHHLRGHGARFAVDGTSSAAECLAWLSREAFDVLLLGERAGDVGAVDLLRTVRSGHARLPVVLLLRERNEHVAAEAMKLGVFDWLVERPGDLAKLPLVLEHAAARQRMAIERAALDGQARLLAALRSGVAFDEVLGRVVETTRDLLRAEWSLVLLMENTDTLVPRAWTDDAPPGLVGARLSVGAGERATPGTSFVSLRGESIPVTGPWSVAPVLAGLDSVITVPLMARGRAVGALLVGAPPARRLTPADEAALRMLADLTGLAVGNHVVTDELVYAQRLSTVGRMVAGVAHELNNPLAVVVGTVDLLRRQPLPDRLAARLERVSAQAGRAVKIVQGLLAFVRSRPADRTTVHLNELLEEVLELAAYDLRHADVRVVRDLPGDLPPVSGQPDQLHQLFTNLVLNACQAIGGARRAGILTITARADPATGRIQVSVADDGLVSRPGS